MTEAIGIHVLLPILKKGTKSTFPCSENGILLKKCEILSVLYKKRTSYEALFLIEFNIVGAERFELSTS